MGRQRQRQRQRCPSMTASSAASMAQQVSDALTLMAASYEQDGCPIQAINCLVALVGQQKGLTPDAEAKARLHLARLLLGHTANTKEALGHLNRAVSREGPQSAHGGMCRHTLCRPPPPNAHTNTNQTRCGPSHRSVALPAMQQLLANALLGNYCLKAEVSNQLAHCYAAGGDDARQLLALRQGLEVWRAAHGSNERCGTQQPSGAPVRTHLGGVEGGCM